MKVKFGKQEGRFSVAGPAFRIVLALLACLIAGSAWLLSQGQSVSACGDTCYEYGIQLDGIWLAYWIDTVVEVPGSGYWTFNVDPNNTNQYSNPVWSGTVICTFHLNPGYAFVRWELNGLPTTYVSGYTVTVSNKSDYWQSYLTDHNGYFYLSALCDPSTVTIETKTATGFVWDTPAAAGTYTVAIGSYFTIAVEIAPAYQANYEFGGWLGDSDTLDAIVDTSSMTTSIFVTDVLFDTAGGDYWVQPSLKSKAPSAEATLDVFTQAASTTVWYNASGYKCPALSGGSDNEMVTGLAVGSVVGVYTETTDNGSVFTGWSCVGCTASDATATCTAITITQAGADTCEATWGQQSEQVYVVTIAASGGGTTSPVPGSYNYMYGTPCIAYAVAKSGYTFSTWSGQDPTAYLHGTSIEFVVTHNVTITAYFSTPGGGGPSGPGATTQGLWGDLLNILDDVGLGNSMGKMFATVIGMLLAFILCRKSKAMSIVAPLAVLGVAIVGNWVSLWIVILLALGLGVTIAGFALRKVSGRGA